jgi:hypothetical protein
MAKLKSKELAKFVMENLSEEKRSEFLDKILGNFLNDEDDENEADEISKIPKIVDKDVALIQLQKNYELYHIPYNFEVGQILKWKKGMKNRFRPDYEMPVVVIEILTAPIISEDEEFYSPYFREKIDIIIGLNDDDDEFVFIHCDRNRFEPF